MELQASSVVLALLLIALTTTNNGVDAVLRGSPQSSSNRELATQLILIDLQEHMDSMNNNNNEGDFPPEGSEGALPPIEEAVGIATFVDETTTPEPTAESTSERVPLQPTAEPTTSPMLLDITEFYANETAYTKDTNTSTATAGDKDGTLIEVMDIDFGPTMTPTEAPTFEPFGQIDYVGNDNTGFYAPFPLGPCQGDCDTDEDCQEGLYCHQRNSFQDVPWCTDGDIYSSSADFCAWNQTAHPERPTPATKYDFGEYDYVGNDGTFYSEFPLKVCKGDCDSDADCADGLFCFDRQPNGGIPGCTGGQEDSTTADVCVWNTSQPLPTPDPELPEDAFRLKLYWQEGYLWQNETFEREWCMYRDFDGYPGTGGCWYARDFKNCSSDRIYMGLCTDGDSRQWFTFQELGKKYSEVNEVLIKTAPGFGPQRCFQRDSNAVRLTTNCDPLDPKQRFFALGGSLTGYRFELGQYSGYRLDVCVTNAHHPKSGELIEFHNCEAAREEHDETSYWERFYE